MKIEVRNKKVIVAGSGKSGIGATELLCKVGRSEERRVGKEC